jgi:hypothetical protein
LYNESISLIEVLVRIVALRPTGFTQVQKDFSSGWVVDVCNLFLDY